MSLSDFASIGSAISGIAVLVSLVFLYFQLRHLSAQVRQTERNQRSLINQGATARGIATNAWLTEPHMSAMFSKAISDPVTLTDIEVFQLSGVLRNAMIAFQDSVVQHRNGLADDITLSHAEASLRFFLSVPAVRAMYRMFAATYASDLREIVDRLVAETPTNPPVEMAARLRVLLSEGRDDGQGHAVRSIEK